MQPMSRVKIAWENNRRESFIAYFASQLINMQIVRRAMVAFNRRRERFTTTQGLNDMEKCAVNNYMIASSSIDDHINGIKPSRGRVMKSWSEILWLFATTFLLATL